MTEVEPVLDFASSGRTGRRNALPDILGSPAGVSPSDLPLKLAEMGEDGMKRGEREQGGSAGQTPGCTPLSSALLLRSPHPRAAPPAGGTRAAAEPRSGPWELFPRSASTVCNRPARSGS
uniref:IPKB inhibitor n=1 Tax=Anser brachyrhynchus TaxID=132585 RepID=A0A8B9I5D8_9AVES